MLSGNCTEALSIQATVTISGSSAKLIQNGIAPLPFPLPALLKQSWYIKRGERVRVRGHAPFYATLGVTWDSHREATGFGASSSSLGSLRVLAEWLGFVKKHLGFVRLSFGAEYLYQ